MSMQKAVLLLGSNLGDKKKHLVTACTLIKKEVGEVIKNSEAEETEPEGFHSENVFLNQVLYIKTTLSPIKLLNRVKMIEKSMGRTYTLSDQKYEDRIIDIDILFYNNIRFKSAELRIPHPQTHARKFVKKLLK